MKQHITKEQWDELSEGDKILWIKQFCIQTKAGVIPCSDDFKTELYPSIGQMIEFLGDDWYEKLFVAQKKDGVCDEHSCNSIEYLEKLYEGELADALWEAVKEKLNK